MPTKSDNHNLNLLLTIVIAVLILFLVFKDKINLGSYHTEQGMPPADNPDIKPSAIQEKLRNFNSMEKQLKLEIVERQENAFLNNKTVANLQEKAARLTITLEQITAKENLAREELEQEKLLTEQLMLQLESERLNAQAQMQANTMAEQTIEALNTALEQGQNDALIMRREKEKSSLGSNALEAELQLKKKEIVRSRLEVNRLIKELAKKDRIITSKNLEITRKKSELSRIKQQFVINGS